ncbi:MULTISPECIES: hypothetical protein [Streptomyces]|uniref:hypothetical protein n=1 Tax=Streptomyces TaxID=1883 RepID=UPI001181376A|nr:MULTISPECIES: hypothetical protein [Streptomyces]
MLLHVTRRRGERAGASLRTQLELFPVPERIWKATPDPGLLKISREAQKIVAELDRLARARSWTDATRKKRGRTCWC